MERSCGIAHRCSRGGLYKVGGGGGNSTHQVMSCEFLVLIYWAVMKILTTRCFHARLDKSIGMY